MPKQLLFICHSPSENTKILRDAMIRGINEAETDNVALKVIPPLSANADDVLSCDAIILGTTENFSYMSGALKDFFDRIYYPCLDLTQGKPYVLLVRAGNDGTGTVNSVEKIVTGLRWRAIQPPLICRGEYNSAFTQQCHELGMLTAVSLDCGII